jgi:transaldolase/glucose-6-phosphate isomerase
MMTRSVATPFPIPEEDPMNPLRALQDFGQSIWLDDFRRSLITTGELQTRIAEDGLSGITSNPSTFEKAIAGGADYDDAIEAMEHPHHRGPGALYERLAVEDIRHAADILRPVYDASGGHDGFVSIEVSPYLAMHTAATIAEARRLWQTVGRDNAMIKVPATAAGLPAIRQLMGDGVNVNITLLFSGIMYEAVAEAYLAGLEAFIARGGDPERMASVASFFVSRVDTAVDALLEERLARADRPDERAAVQALLGKAAIANAKLAKQRYKEIFRGKPRERLRRAGARPQRLLWASMGTKNPRYSDVRYVEELIGPNTVSTLPPTTMDAFRHHGRPRASLETGLAQARRVMMDLDALGVSLDAITGKLIADGVRLFTDAEDKLLSAIERKRAPIASRERANRNTRASASAR